MKNVCRLTAVFLAVLTMIVPPAALAQARGTETVDMQAMLQAKVEDAQQIAAIEADKAGFVAGLLDRFAATAAEKGYDAFLSKGTRKLMTKSARDLRDLGERARDFDTFHKLVFEGYTMDTFGSLTQELVFFPISACRIYDSRIATTVGLIGPMTPGTERQISVNDIFGQGGATPECGTAVPDLNNDPPGLAITLTAAGPTGPGNLRTFATLGAVPAAAMLTYTAGTTISTGTVTASCTACGPELTVRNQGAGNTDVVIDIVGYFHAPFLQVPDCTTVTNSATVPANGTSTVTATCPAGYVVTGGGHDTNLISTSLASGMEWYQNSPSGASAWVCRVQNYTVNPSLTNVCLARCCRIPGR